MATAASNSVPLLTGHNNSNGTLVEEFISGLVQGSSWTFGGAPRAITYSLDRNFDGPAQDWTQAWTAAVDKGFAAWEAVANVDFVRLGESNSQLRNDSTADISLVLAPDFAGGIASAVGLYPDPVLADLFLEGAGYTRDLSGLSYPRPEGDITFDSQDQIFQDLAPGGLGFHVILHEIGHALGLKHTGDGGNDRPTFAELGLGGMQGPPYTVMNGSVLETEQSPLTPMLADIAAIQHIYGANAATATGNTVYLFDLDEPFFKCIWDAGGTDTISVANFTRGCTINLNAGSFSSINVLSGEQPQGTNNLSIAYGVVIEQGFGGAGADRLIGNTAANALVGNAGSDIITGAAGNDTIVGGAGTDIINGGVGTDKIRGDAGADTITFGPTDSIDGGYGNLDTLKIASGNLDLTRLINTRIINIEKINMTAGGANTLTLNTLDVLALSSTVNTVTILGDAADTVDLVGDFTLESTVGNIETWRSGSALVLIELEMNVI